MLILRAKGSKPPERRGRVLFINADRDYREGRAQNHLRPRDEQKITAAYRSFADIDGFARVVTVKELARQRLQLQHPPLRRQLPAARTSGRACPPPRRRPHRGNRPALTSASPALMNTAGEVGRSVIFGFKRPL